MSRRLRRRGRWVGLAAASVVVAFLDWWGTAAVIGATLLIVFADEVGVDTERGWTRFLLLARPGRRVNDVDR